MAGKAIGLSLRQGFLGSPSRSNPTPEIYTRPAGEALVFGDPLVVTTDGELRKMTSGDAITDFAGICCRGINHPLTYASQNGENGYADGEASSVLKKGFVIVKTVGTPAPNGKVYVNITAGTLSASATDNALIPHARFSTGVKDSNGTCEIEISAI